VPSVSGPDLTLSLCASYSGYERPFPRRQGDPRRASEAGNLRRPLPPLASHQADAGHPLQAGTAEASAGAATAPEAAGRAEHGCGADARHEAAAELNKSNGNRSPVDLGSIWAGLSTAMSGPNAPAWVQGIGSILAIVVAISVPALQLRAVRKDTEAQRKREEKERLRRMVAGLRGCGLKLMPL
jgi:hypothetical protein